MAQKRDWCWASGFGERAVELEPRALSAAGPFRITSDFAISTLPANVWRPPAAMVGGVHAEIQGAAIAPDDCCVKAVWGDRVLLKSSGHIFG